MKLVLGLGMGGVEGEGRGGMVRGGVGGMGVSGRGRKTLGESFRR